METLKSIGQFTGIIFVIFGCISLTMGCNFWVNNGAIEFGVYGGGQADRMQLMRFWVTGFSLYVIGLLIFLFAKASDWWGESEDK